jgi:hypothetical protein
MSYAGTEYLAKATLEQANLISTRLMVNDWTEKANEF